MSTTMLVILAAIGCLALLVLFSFLGRASPGRRSAPSYDALKGKLRQACDALAQKYTEPETSSLAGLLSTLISEVVRLEEEYVAARKSGSQAEALAPVSTSYANAIQQLLQAANELLFKIGALQQAIILIPNVMLIYHPDRFQSDEDEIVGMLEKVSRQLDSLRQVSIVIDPLSQLVQQEFITRVAAGEKMPEDAGGIIADAYARAALVHLEARATDALRPVQE